MLYTIKGFIMGFRINTNIAAMNAHTNATMNNRNLDGSLAKLSSGLRINTAADDASGMAIADSLRSQASSLGQAIANANDAIGILQIADKAMDEQLKILDTIKVKAIQAAQDGQSADSRKALQADIVRLMESLDNIATTTSYNGQTLLSGSFTNKEFQIGAYSNQTVKASIGDTTSYKIGGTSYATGISVSTGDAIALSFSTGVDTVTLASITVNSEAGKGINRLADAINNVTDKTGIRAGWTVETVMSVAIANTSIDGLTINGVKIGNITSAKANDSDGQVVNAINAVKELTGVEASIDEGGFLHLRSLDGRAITVSTAAATNGGIIDGGNIGKLTLSRLDARSVIVSGTNYSSAGLLETALTNSIVNLSDVRNEIGSTQAKAIGGNAYSSALGDISNGIGAGVTSLVGAMATMNIAESALKSLDRIRADLGSAQNQIVSTINNISVTQVNVKAAESSIRDVDFAAESANFSKYNILAQSGSYAMSQANAVQQNVLKLLQ